MAFLFSKEGGDFMHVPKRNDEAKYRTVDQIMSEINLCRGTVVKIAKDAGAYFRIVRSVRIDADRFFDYVEKKYRD